MKLKLILLSFFIVINANLYAGNGSETKSLTGTVTDAKSGESLAGALISVEGTNIKVYSDLDGNFYIDNVEVGVHEIKISLITYKDLVFKNDLKTSSKGLEIKLEPIL